MKTKLIFIALRVDKCFVSDIFLSNKKSYII